MSEIEMRRRLAFLCGQVEEAMGFLENDRDTGARYWAYKALVRANDMAKEMLRGPLGR